MSQMSEPLPVQSGPCAKLVETLESMLNSDRDRDMERPDKKKEDLEIVEKAAEKLDESHETNLAKIKRLEEELEEGNQKYLGLLRQNVFLKKRVNQLKDWLDKASVKKAKTTSIPPEKGDGEGV